MRLQDCSRDMPQQYDENFTLVTRYDQYIGVGYIRCCENANMHLDPYGITGFQHERAYLSHFVTQHTSYLQQKCIQYGDAANMRDCVKYESCRWTMPYCRTTPLHQTLTYLLQDFHHP